MGKEYVAEGLVQAFARGRARDIVEAPGARGIARLRNGDLLVEGPVRVVRKDELADEPPVGHAVVEDDGVPVVAGSAGGAEGGEEGASAVPTVAMVSSGTLEVRPGPAPRNAAGNESKGAK